MEKITSLEIDLIDACNLSCPLCNRNKHISKDGYLDKIEWVKIIMNYPDLETVYFLGTRSEHTLHPQFLDICEFLKQLGVNIILSTNGDTHKPNWWNKLSKILDNNDEVRFAIDGSTQEVYEKYRVGGNLSNVLMNHLAFKNKHNNDVLQYILFDHNKSDDVNVLFSWFNGARVINSSFGTGAVRPTDLYIKKYEVLDKFVQRIKSPQIQCETKGEQHFINYKGLVSPCCHYNEHLVLNGKLWDGGYDDIENAEHDFCTRICDKTCSKIRRELNIEL